MITAWVATASAQFFSSPKNQCSVDDAFPIAGTSGFDNALLALRTNAATYSASSFAEKHALRSIALGERGTDVGVVQMEANLHWGVTRVPVYQEDATYGECPAEYVLGTRPVDMYAYNLGLAFRWHRVGAFYASSVTLGYPAELAYLRMYQTMGSLVTVPFMSVAVPLTGSFQTQTGASAYAQDFVAGVLVDLEVADLRAGYTQSRGWYLSGQDRYVGAFGSLVLRDGFTLVGQARGGLERTPLPEAVEKVVGRPSIFARSLPLTEPTDTPDTPDDQRTQLSLLTGHVAEEGLFRRVDVRFSYAFAPVVQVNDAAVAVHDPEWYVAGDGGTPSARIHWYGEAGIVGVPPQYYYGLPGATLIQARAVVQGQLGEEGTGVVTLMFNDPEQVALYPFARNSLAVRLQVGSAL